MSFWSCISLLPASASPSLWMPRVKQGVAIVTSILKNSSNALITILPLPGLWKQILRISTFRGDGTVLKPVPGVVEHSHTYSFRLCYLELWEFLHFNTVLISTLWGTLSPFWNEDGPCFHFSMIYVLWYCEITLRKPIIKCFTTRFVPKSPSHFESKNKCKTVPH